MIHPQQVAALGSRISIQGSQDGNAQLLIRARHSSLFAAPFLLAHAQDDRPVIGNKRGIEGVDGVGVIGQVFVVIDHFRAARTQYICQGIMLLLRKRQVGASNVMPFPWIGRAKSLVGTLQEYGAQR